MEVIVIPYNCTDECFRDLCNAIVLRAVDDCIRGRMAVHTLERFLKSEWGKALLRGAADPDAILKITIIRRTERHDRLQSRRETGE